ncbi:MAG: LamG domain-containing protein [Candidatus Aenigmarchaeota archaeon]|nr:LamG domain-containing protein [Candidatus Aenigmarchaeota archaeon]
MQREPAKPRKAQVWGMDFVLSAIIFLSAFAMVLFAWSYANGQAAGQIQLNELQRKALEASEMLARTAGSPPDWDTANVTLAGLASSEGVLNTTKVRRFLRLDYNGSKIALNLGNYEYYFALLGRDGLALNLSPAGVPAMAAWRLNESAGSIAYDAIAGLGLELNGSSWSPSCVSGPCLDFDGTDDYGNASLPSMPLNGSFSISLWFRARDDGALAGRHDAIGPIGQGFFAAIAAGRPEFSIYDGNSALHTVTGSVAQPGVWHHYLAAYDNSRDELRLYLDGQPNASQPGIGGFNPENGLDFTVGRYAHALAGHFNGSLDELAIYQAALSSTDALDLYQMQLPAVAGLAAAPSAAMIVPVERYVLLQGQPATMRLMVWSR